MKVQSLKNRQGAEEEGGRGEGEEGERRRESRGKGRGRRFGGLVKLGLKSFYKSTVIKTTQSW